MKGAGHPMGAGGKETAGLHKHFMSRCEVILAVCAHLGKKKARRERERERDREREEKEM